MNSNDAERLAPEFIQEVSRGLPYDWSIAFISYNNSVQTVVPFGSERGELAKTVATVHYEGYTDAGSALAQAMEMLAAVRVDRRVVVVVSDGEILLGDAEATARSQHDFDAAMKQAAELGVVVRTVAIGDRKSMPQANVLGGAVNRIYGVDTARQLPEMARSLLFEDFGVQRLSVGGGESRNGVLHVKIPLQNLASVDCAKILLVSDVPLGEVTADYNAADGVVDLARYFALVDLTRPEDADIALHFRTKESGSVRADLLLEMRARIEARTTDSGGEKIEVQLIPLSVDGHGVRLLDDPYFEGKTVAVKVDEKEIAAKVEQGAIAFSLAKEAADGARAEIRYTDLGVNLIAPKSVALSAPTSRGHRWLFFGGFAAVAISGLFFWRRKDAQTKSAHHQAIQNAYTGMLKIYIVHAPDDSDIAPMVYNLYRRFDATEISLTEILEHCGISVALPGARDIFFAPGKEKALALRNGSDCTILKNQALLVKDQSCLVHFNERVHISFTDERSEMILEYKNVKPSERQ